jgi:hypothetical protein
MPQQISLEQKIKDLAEKRDRNAKGTDAIGLVSNTTGVVTLVSFPALIVLTISTPICMPIIFAYAITMGVHLNAAQQAEETKDSIQQEIQDFMLDVILSKFQGHEIDTKGFSQVHKSLFNQINQQISSFMTVGDNEIKITLQDNTQDMKIWNRKRNLEKDINTFMSSQASPEVKKNKLKNILNDIKTLQENSKKAPNQNRGPAIS